MLEQRADGPRAAAARRLPVRVRVGHLRGRGAIEPPTRAARAHDRADHLPAARFDAGVGDNDRASGHLHRRSRGQVDDGSGDPAIGDSITEIDKILGAGAVQFAEATRHQLVDPGRWPNVTRSRNCWICAPDGRPEPSAMRTTTWPGVDCSTSSEPRNTRARDPANVDEPPGRAGVPSHCRAARPRRSSGDLGGWGRGKGRSGTGFRRYCQLTDH